MTRSIDDARGFTLIEMAVVVAVMALLLGSIVVPLSTQIESRRFSDTRRILDQAREALIGFAVANARLPCPASGTTTGVESMSSGACTHPYDGFLPAATLAILPADDKGFAVDPWGNRIRYAVTTSDGNAFVTANGIRDRFLLSTPSPDLHVCSTGQGPTTGPGCPSGPPDSTLTNSAPAVIYSTGPNGLHGGTSVDEAENPNPNSSNKDRLFVSRPVRSEGTAAGAFDDIVVWLSAHVLYSQMVAAGKLP